MAPFDPFDPTTLLGEPSSTNHVWLTPVARERFVVCDEIDYEWLLRWNWHLHINQRGNPYPARQQGNAEAGTQVRIYMHRAVLIRAAGPPPTRERCIADHINGDVFDVRRTNLRWVTRRENALNTHKFRATHGVAYVSPAIERYFARFGL